MTSTFHDEEETMNEKVSSVLIFIGALFLLGGLILFYEFKNKLIPCGVLMLGFASIGIGIAKNDAMPLFVRVIIPLICVLFLYILFHMYREMVVSDFFVHTLKTTVEVVFY